MAENSPGEAPALRASPRLTVLVLMVGTFMASFDSSIVNLATPTIQRDLHATYAEVQWLIAGYFLAYGSLVITGGKIGDRFGRRNTYVFGLIMFAIASAVCGFASNPHLLLAARIAQGVAAAIDGPQGLGMVQTVLPPARRAKAFAAVTMTLSLGAFLGPVIGGVIIDADFFGLSWRPIFLLNVPIGVITAAVALRILPSARNPSPPRLDLVGSLLAALGLSLLLFPLVQGRNDGWPFWMFLMLAGAPVILAILLIRCGRRVASGGSALINPQFFRLPQFSVPAATLFIVMAAYWAFSLGVMFYVQVGLRFTALHAAFTLLAYVVAQVFGSRYAARLYSRFGRILFFAGITTYIVAVFGSLTVIQLVGDSLVGWELIPTLGIGGVSIGIMFPVVRQTLMGSVPAKDAGAASGFLSLAQLTGSAFGIAIVGLLYFSSLGPYSSTATQAPARGLRSALISSGMSEEQTSRTLSGVATCVRDRVSGSDPYALPPSCNFQGYSPTASAAIDSAIAKSISEDFRHALESSMGIIAASTLLTFVGFTRLPRRSAAAATASPVTPPVLVSSPSTEQIPASAANPSGTAPHVTEASVPRPAPSQLGAVPSLEPAVTSPAVGAHQSAPSTLPTAWHESLKTANQPTGWIPLPAGNAIHCGLQSEYVRFERLLLSIAMRAHTGYVKVISSRIKGAILFVFGEPVIAIAVVEGDLRWGSEALESIARVAAIDGSTIDVVQLDIRLVRCLAHVLVGTKIQTNPALPPIVEMVADLELRQFHGGIVVSSAGDTGVILFVSGLGTLSYLDSSPIPNGGAASVADALVPLRIDLLGVLRPGPAPSADGS